MVFFFKTCNEQYIIYMGKDKFENEELIRYGLPHDIWFHVDGLSSAHVYLRGPEELTPDKIPEDVLEDCLQLVKANSIEGHKLNNVKVVYTPWPNLKKRQSMEVGQVGFHDEKQNHYKTVVKKDNTTVNRINKTRSERPTDIVQKIREAYDKKQKERLKAQKQKEAEERQRQIEEWQKEKQARSYDNLMDEELMETNEDVRAKGQNLEDDFM